MLLEAKDLGVSFGEWLFRHLSFTVSAGERVAIVGNNGAGKSTLVKCLTKLMDPTEGDVIHARTCRIAVVDQALPAVLTAMSLKNVLMSVLSEDERSSHEWKVDMCLDRFETPDSLRSSTLAELSGGWQRLALIMRAYMSEPDLLILDEPTNHLDITFMMKLEEWLVSDLYDTALLTVSHDRQFLDNCTARTMFLRPGRSMVFDKPYSEARGLLDEYDKQQAAQREKEENDLRRLRKSAHTLRQIGVDNFSDSALKKAAAIEKRAQKLEAQTTDVHVEQRRNLTLDDSDIGSKDLVRIRDKTIRALSGAELFKIGHLRIGRGERIGVLGRNGSGKSTFLRFLIEEFRRVKTGSEDPTLKVSPSLSPFYMSQSLSELDNDYTVHNFISEYGRESDSRVTAALVSAGFPFKQHTVKIGTLSPGEKARLALLALKSARPNFFVMDEPTNHLDISGQEQLEMELAQRDTATILVSHDRHFLRTVPNRYLMIDGGKLWNISGFDPFLEALTSGRRIEACDSNATVV